MSATHSIHALAQFIVESSCETHDGLDMLCMREHINAPDLFYLIAVFSKGDKVAGEGLGVAGDVNNALWRKGNKTA